MIAALFVETNGAYYGIDGVDPWDEQRDARLYAGPHPVVAHPPCGRWGRYWFGGPSVKVRKNLGDDQGCFESALESVRRWGGVLEHPAHSYAWQRFHLAEPHGYRWTPSLFGGYSIEVDQGHYGHMAVKPTWLFVSGATMDQLPPLKAGRSPALARIDDGFHSAAERAAAKAAGWVSGPRLSAKQRAATPIPFRDLLLSIARSARGTT